MSGKKRTEPQASVDPYDHTVIIPGVPEMPQEPTLTLPVNSPPSQPRPDFEVPRPEKPSLEIQSPARPRRGTFIALWVGAVILLTGGFTWWLLGTGTSSTGPMKAPVATTAALPPAMQGYLDAAQKGDAKAMRMLGASYTYGLGVHPDPAKGAEWYRKAADAGDKMATQELQAAGGAR